MHSSIPLSKQRRYLWSQIPLTLYRASRHIRLLSYFLVYMLLCYSKIIFFEFWYLNWKLDVSSPILRHYQLFSSRQNAVKNFWTTSVSEKAREWRWRPESTTLKISSWRWRFFSYIYIVFLYYLDHILSLKNSFIGHTIFFRSVH